MRRVDELLQRELSSYCERAVSREVAGLVTITQVKTSSDLRHAKVFYSVLGTPEAQAAALETLCQHRRDMQHQIAATVQLKFTPVLSFHLDNSPAQGDHVLSILDDLHLLRPDPENEQAAAPPDETP